jgi:hypothetical protein
MANSPCGNQSYQPREKMKPAVHFGSFHFKVKKFDYFTHDENFLSGINSKPTLKYNLKR